MKVLYVITKAERGGAQSVLLELLIAHKERGDTVLLVCGTNGFLVEKNRELGFKSVVVSTLSNTFNPFSIYRSFSRLKNIAKQFSPDIISCHSSFAGFIGRLALGKKYPTVFTAHGIAFTQGAPLWRKPIAITAEFIASFFCKKIIAVSENDKRSLKKFLFLKDKKIVTVHNGVDVTNFIPFPKLNSDSIVFVGRLVPPKNPFVLIYALDILKRGGDKVPKLSIIGNGYQMTELEKLIKNLGLGQYVHMMGECEEMVVRETLRSSSLFVLPTMWEGFPMTILEAMAEGCAVLASDVGGIREAVTKEEGVLLSRCANAEVWANAIKKMLSDKARLEHMGRSSHKRTGENFSKEQMVTKTFEVYISMI